jgi:hypothetical protein
MVTNLQSVIFASFDCFCHPPSKIEHPKKKKCPDTSFGTPDASFGTPDASFGQVVAGFGWVFGVFEELIE